MGIFEAAARFFSPPPRQTEQWREKVEASLYLVEALEPFISQRYGNGEDGVGGVLVEAGLAVSSEQSQRPASADKRGRRERWAQSGHVCKHHDVFPDSKQLGAPRGCKHSYKGNK